MLQSFSKLGLAVLLGTLTLTSAIALGQGGRTPVVIDEAKVFSKGAVESANKTIKAIHDRHHKDLQIETTTKDIEDRDAYAKQRFDELRIDGIYVLFIKDKAGVSWRYRIGDNTLQKGYFTSEDRKGLEDAIRAGLKRKPDEALTEITNFVSERINKNKPATAAPKKEKGKKAEEQQQAQAQQPQQGANPGAVPAKQPESQGTNWMGWICLIIGVLLVIWVVFAIIRAVSGMGGGGYGPGYGGPGYGGGFGGGGFFTGLLGGMFGAMAGMWIYNNFFGGHSTYRDWGMNTPPGHTDTGEAVGTSEPYQADTGAGVGGGEDAGGGDAGGGDAGGGEWGGGGGDAGGGDWGGGDAGGDAGGGGDWGGGGGGDWGGGGGGDWGGGGGDFGGGGGGDW